MKSIDVFILNEKCYIRKTDYKNRVMIILMSTPSAIHILTAALKIKKGDVNRGIKARRVIMQASSSIWVTVPIGTITMILAAIDAFNVAEGPAKKTAWDAVNTGLKSVMRLFSNAMDLDPVHSEEICISGGFSVKKVAIKQKQVFGLSQGPSSGILNCIGDIVKGDSCHDWLLSRDGVDYIRQRPTPNSFKQFTGLAPGRWWVQHQCILANGKDGPFLTLFIDLI
jgi:hypothetical protein